MGGASVARLGLLSWAAADASPGWRSADGPLWIPMEAVRLWHAISLVRCRRHRSGSWRGTVFISPLCFTDHVCSHRAGADCDASSAFARIARKGVRALPDAGDSRIMPLDAGS